MMYLFALQGNQTDLFPYLCFMCRVADAQPLLCIYFTRETVCTLKLFGTHYVSLQKDDRNVARNALIKPILIAPNQSLQHTRDDTFYGVQMQLMGALPTDCLSTLRKDWKTSDIWILFAIRFMRFVITTQSDISLI